MMVTNPDYEGMAVFTPVINGEKLPLKIISTWLSCMDRLTVFVMVVIIVFSIIFVGAGGNLVAIQASRMSTFFHYWSASEDHPVRLTGSCLDVFCSSG